MLSRKWVSTNAWNQYQHLPKMLLGSTLNNPRTFAACAGHPGWRWTDHNSQKFWIDSCSRNSVWIGIAYSIMEAFDAIWKDLEWLLIYNLPPLPPSSKTRWPDGSMLDFHWFSMFFIDFHWFSLFFIDFHWFSSIFTNFHWFSLVFIDFHRFSSIFIDFHWFWRCFGPES